jgi:peroxiredoxin Q/BCP
MRTSALSSLVVASLVATQLVAQQPGTPPAPPANFPTVGMVAPDFTAPIAGKDGVGQPVTLSKLKGKVVVLAFYPQDRTSGCTAEMTKYTKEYATLFGDGVVVLPISKDNLDSHASWAKDMGMPFSLVSDTSGTVAQAYASQRQPGAAFTRNTFVIGKDGKIAYAVFRFSALSEDAYTALGQAVAEAKK